jgi:DNA (cytosine-5)-methyltransferase 1
MIRVFTAFSGYDSQCMALDRIGVEYDLVGWSEIDKYAIAAHNAVYPQFAERNFGDISKIDWSEVPDFDLFTYSSPCQDFSVAGLQRGGEKGSGTRSSLLWECERAIAAKRPKYLVFENVAALVSEKFIKLFNSWQLLLEQYGYTNFTQVLNAKDYGVPQNRERVFMVSVRDCDATYYFPDKVKLTKCLRDILEENVPEEYYLSERMLQCMEAHNERHLAKGTGFIFKPKDGSECATTLRANSALCPKDNTIKVVAQLVGGKWDNTLAQNGRVFDTSAIAPTQTAGGGGNIETKILVAGEIRGGAFDRELNCYKKVYNAKGISPTLLASMDANTKAPKVINYEQPTDKVSQ